MTETTKYNFWCQTTELLVGDVVDTGNPMNPREPWCTAIVEKVDATFVHLYRPYGHHSPVTYGDPPSVICYTGCEEYKVERSLDQNWTVFRRDLTLHKPSPKPIYNKEVETLRALVEREVAKHKGAISKEMMPLVSLVEKLEARR